VSWLAAGRCRFSACSTPEAHKCARMAIPIVLSIAGSDSGGGAGIQADLKACEANGAFGTTAIAALTAQNTIGVQGVHAIPAEFVTQQIDSVVSDIGCSAAKTGMLPTQDIIRAVAAALKAHAISLVVVDPVMVASSGDPLIAPDAVAAFKTELFPLASIITPNLPEASHLLGRPVTTLDEMEAAAKELLAMGPRSVLLKVLGASCVFCRCHCRARHLQRARRVVACSLMRS
jgi:hydroxymethylpyrimidine/phosphomethylpyrimidine kinase